MGVVHKLSEEVISYIISQKKDNPSIGVRKIAALTSEKFQITISKSSVNSVLKSASLSSSVGRRSITGAGKGKFKLPEFRKEQISGNMEKAGVTKDEIVPVIEGPSPPERETEEDQALPLMPDPVAQIQPPPAENKGSDEPVESETSIDQDFISRVGQIREQRQQQRSGDQAGMGCVFLKAAEWEISSRSITAGLFKKHISEGRSPDDLDVAGEMFLFLKYSGCGSYDECSAYQGDALWALNKLGYESTDEENIKSKLKEMFEWPAADSESLLSGVEMEYHLEKDQQFQEVSGFRLFLEDGMRLNADARLSTITNKVLPSVGYTSALPVNTAMARLSNHLISNNSDIILRVAGGADEFDKSFYNMVSVFEQFSGKTINKISAMNEKEESLAEFTTVPNQKRTFMIGVAPNQKEFGLLTGNVKWAGKKPFYHAETGQTIAFAETRANCLEGQFQKNISAFRVITVWGEGGKKPCWAVLTNKEKGEVEDILKAYMDRWPYFIGHLSNTSSDEGGAEGARGPNEIRQEAGIVKFPNIPNDLIMRLNEYCAKRFFPARYTKNDLSSMKQTVYDLSGSIYQDKGCTSVFLNIPGSSPNTNDLEYAVRTVNESHIFDHSGRKLWLEIGTK